MLMLLFAISFLGSVAFTLFLRRLDRSSTKVAQLKRLGELAAQKIEELSLTRVQGIKDASLEFEMLVRQGRQAEQDLKGDLIAYQERIRSLREDRQVIENIAGELSGIAKTAQNVSLEVERLDQGLVRLGIAGKEITEIQKSVHNLHHVIQQKGADADSKLGLVVSKLVQETEERTRVLTEQVRSSFHVVKDEVRQTSERLDEYNREAEIIGERLSGMSTRMDDKWTLEAGRLDEKFMTLERKFTDRLTALEGGLSSVRTSAVESLQGEVGRIRQEIEGFSLQTLAARDEILNETKRMAQGTSEQIAQFQEKYLSAENKLLKHAEQQKAALREKMESFETEWTEMERERLGALDTRIQSLEKEIDSVRQKRIDDSLADVKSEITEIQDNLTLLGQELRSDIKAETDTSVSRIRETRRAEEELLSRGREQLDSLREEVGNRLREVEAQMKEASRSREKIEQAGIEASREIQQARADAAREIAESKSDAAREITQIKSEAAREMTETKSDGARHLEQIRSEASQEIEEARTGMFREIEGARTSITKEIETARAIAAADIEAARTMAANEIEAARGGASEEIEGIWTSASREIGEARTSVSKEITEVRVSAFRDMERSRDNTIEEMAKRARQFIEEQESKLDRLDRSVDERILRRTQEIERESGRLREFEEQLAKFDKAQDLIEKLDETVEVIVDRLRLARDENAKMDEYVRNFESLRVTRKDVENELRSLESQRDRLRDAQDAVDRVEKDLGRIADRFAAVENGEQLAADLELKIERLSELQGNFDRYFSDLAEKEKFLQNAVRYIEKSKEQAGAAKETAEKLIGKVERAEIRQDEVSKSLQSVEARSMELLRLESEIQKVESRFEQMDGLMADLESRQKQISGMTKRIEEMKTKGDEIRTELESVVSEADEKMDRMTAFFQTVEKLLDTALEAESGEAVLATVGARQGRAGSERGGRKSTATKGQIADWKRDSIMSLYLNHKWDADLIAQRMKLDPAVVRAVIGSHTT